MFCRYEMHRREGTVRRSTEGLAEWRLTIPAFIRLKKEKKTPHSHISRWRASKAAVIETIPDTVGCTRVLVEGRYRTNRREERRLQMRNMSCADWYRLLRVASQIYTNRRWDGTLSKINNHNTNTIIMNNAHPPSLPWHEPTLRARAARSKSE
jgi:hypothetical protein